MESHCPRASYLRKPEKKKIELRPPPLLTHARSLPFGQLLRTHAKCLSLCSSPQHIALSCHTVHQRGAVFYVSFSLRLERLAAFHRLRGSISRLVQQRRFSSSFFFSPPASEQEPGPAVKIVVRVTKREGRKRDELLRVRRTAWARSLHALSQCKQSYGALVQKVISLPRKRHGRTSRRGAI